MAYEGLKSRYGNTPSIYIDFNTENQGKKFLNTNVISPKEICNEEFDYICICALNSDYIIKNYLSNEQKKKLINPKELVYEINYEDVENKFTTNRLKTLADQLVFSYNSYNDWSKSQDININSLDLVLTERCTLKCQDCSNLMQYYQKPINAELKDLEDGLEIFMAQVNCLHELRIIGGEPLINKNIYDLVIKASKYENINNIVIYTNGTIIPKQEELLKIKDVKNLSFKISDYGSTLSKKAELLEQTLKIHRIFTIREPINTWQDAGRIVENSDNEVELKDKYGQCCVRDCLTMLHDKIFICPFSANLYTLDPEKFQGVEYLQTQELNQKGRSALKEFIEGKKYLFGCKYCNGRSHNSKLIPAAQQTKKPLPLG